MSTEIVKQMPLGIAEMQTMAKLFAESGMFPNVNSMAKAFIKIQAGIELGIPPFSAMSGIHIIKEKATIGAGLMAGKIKESGKYDYKVIELTEKKCSIDFLEGGKKVGTETFTIEDAKKAGTQNIEKFPKNMLFARAISNGMKFYCPDLYTMPVYTPEEMNTVVEDIPHEVVDAPAPVKAKPKAVTAPIVDTEMVQHYIDNLAKCDSVADMTEYKKQVPALIVADASFIDAAMKRYNLIMAAAV